MSSVSIISWPGDSLPVESKTTICGWAPPQYTDAGEGTLNTVLSVVAFAVAIWSAYEQMRIFNMRYKIAEGYANLAEQQWTRFDTRYKPIEAMLVAECLAELPVEPDYPAARSRGEAFADHGLAQGNLAWERDLRIYRLCPGLGRMRSMAAAGALLLDDTVNFSMRDEEADAIVEDDMRFNRRAGLLNLGRDLLSTSAKYAEVANNLLASAAAAQAQTTAGAMAFLGYIRNREETAYPAFLSHSTSPGAILGGSSSGVGLMPSPV